MDAGLLNREVKIKRPEGGSDEAGQPLLGWIDVAKVWANIKFQSGSESIRADAVTSVARASIRIRYREDIDASMRVYRGTAVYSIKAVLPDEARREYVDLVCEVIA